MYRRSVCKMVMFTVILVTAIRMIAQHDHPAPEKLGTVDFPTTCSPKVQAQFNAWAEETGLPYVHLSRICALSIGENRAEQE